MSAHEVTKALGGSWHGRYGIARCPCHDDRNPSLQVSDGDNGDLVAHCFAGCDWRDIKSVLRSRGLIPEWTPTEPGCAHRQLLKDGKPLAPGQGAGGGAAGAAARDRNTTFALELWRSARPAAVIAETYFARRGLELAIPPTIREIAALKHGPSGQTLPCLIAAVQGPDGKIIAIHRTYLCANYSAKADVSPQKMALGSIKSGKVRLAKAAPTLAICEGIETGLSIQERYGLATWCALGASNLPNMVLPPEVHRVIVCADNGAPGIATAENAAARFGVEGREVFIARPPDGMGDFNDLICK